MVTKWSPLPIKEGGTDGTTPKSARRALGISEGVSSDNFVSVKDFPFGAVGDGVTDDTAAIQAGDAAAALLGKQLYFPGTATKYIYKPSAGYVPLANWIGDGPETTKIEVDTSLFSGVIFNWQSGFTVEGIQFQQKGNTKAGTGIQIQAANPANFVSYPRLFRVWIFGFAIDLDLGQSFGLTTVSCRLENATTGLNCTPTGFITTHTHIDLTLNNNTQNIKYVPTVNSGPVVFTDLINQDSTGALAQAQLTNLLLCEVNGGYSEGNSTQPAFATNSSNVTFNGYKLAGTGGLSLSGNSNVKINNIQTTSATDVLNAQSSMQSLMVENSLFPSSGNTLAAPIQTIINSTINGIVYGTPFFGSAANASSGQNYSLINAQIRQDLQIPTVSGAGATDVYRFLDAVGTLLTPSLAGRFFINAADTSTGANQAQYIYDLISSGNGTTDAVLTQIARHVRGTDPGTSATPFAVANDGGGGGLKLQFTKNAAIANVRLRIMFVGTVTNSI